MVFVIVINNKIYDISELVTKVSWNDRLNDGCSKLEFSYKDNGLKIENGSNIQFIRNGIKIFNGFVFKYGWGKDKVVNVTAYDQLRYCKVKDSIVIMNDTVTTLVNRMCNYFLFKKGSITGTKYTLKTMVINNQTWLDIIYTAISDTLTNTGKWYCLRDEFGHIALRDLGDLKLNLILGDGSSCYEYDYQKSIDDNFYNHIKIYSEGDSVKSSQMIGLEDTNSVKKFGRLQYFEVMNNANAAQVKAKADILLRFYNHEAESFTLNCIGDTSIRAGSSFYGMLEDVLGKNKLVNLFVKSVTHDFLPIHTMKIEVLI
jgi:hypothetical protein